MKLVALTGYSFTGKTTVAKALQEKGFVVLNFTDHLKALLISALAAVGVEVTLGDIHAKKELYRPLLMEFAHIIGFDNDPKYVKQVLEPWLQAGEDQSAVFDTVYYKEQMDVLAGYGFKSVELVLAGYERYERAKKKGLSFADFQKSAENNRVLAYSTLTIDASLPTAEIVNQIMSR